MCPQIFHIFGPLSIQGYGLMLGIGVTFLVFLAYRHPVRKQIVSKDIFFNTLVISVISGIIGGRLLHVLFDLDGFKDNLLEMLYPWVGGFSMIGTILAILITVPIYLKRHKVSVVSFLDLAGLYAPVIQIFGRIGCFLGGCCYGISTITQKWYSVTFTNPNCLAPTNIPLHPSQLYASATSVGILIIMNLVVKLMRKYKLDNSKIFGSGIIISSYLFLESLSRFILEFWRGDDVFIKTTFAQVITKTFTSYQLISFGIFVFSAVMLVFAVKRVKKHS